jgi:hypothetical protein
LQKKGGVRLIEITTKYSCSYLLRQFKKPIAFMEMQKVAENELIGFTPFITLKLLLHFILILTKVKSTSITICIQIQESDSLPMGTVGASPRYIATSSWTL